MHMTKATNYLGKDLSSAKEPSPQRWTGPPPTLRNVALTDKHIYVMLGLYRDNIVVILRPTEKGITDGAVCVLVASPRAKVVRRLAERVVWLEVEIFGQDRTRRKSFLSVNFIGMTFFYGSTAKVQQTYISSQGLLPTKVKSPAVSNTSCSVWLYITMVFNRISRPGSQDLFGAYTSIQLGCLTLIARQVRLFSFYTWRHMDAWWFLY